MKAKALAEQLLKYPDFDVEFDICTQLPTYDHPWPKYQSYRIIGIDDIAHTSKVIVLEVEEVENDEFKYIDE